MKFRIPEVRSFDRAASLPYFIAAILAGAVGPVGNACDRTSHEIALSPEHISTIAVPAQSAAVLLEEIGADVEYRWSGDDAFVALETPPNRLGFVVLPRRSHEVSVRIAADQGPGGARVTACLRDGETEFFAQLAEFYTHHVGAGAKAARAAAPAIAALSALPADPLRRAWIATAQANVLLASGQSVNSATAFLKTRALWLAVARTDRAAIATMAAGEEASRANRYDDARVLLEQAQTELAQVEAGYYSLRSAAGLCTILSRQGRYRDAIDCELPVVRSMHERGEHAEATMRHVSIANLWMRVDDYEAAHLELANAQAHADAATPVSQARLSTALGNYFVAVGDLPAAAQEFARAAMRLGSLGVPTDQANVDQKLANLAEFSGARTERLRLLERAAATLDRANTPERHASALVQLGRAQIEHRNPKLALETLDTAKAICDALAQAACLRTIEVARADALIRLGNVDAARALLASLDAGGAQDMLRERALLKAQLALASGDAGRALGLLSQAPALVDDPELDARTARLEAAALTAAGKRAGAVAMLAGKLASQTRQAAAWPSAALRVSARNRLADLQAMLFDLLTAGTGDTIDATTFTLIAEAIDVASVHALFHAAATTMLPTELRSTLSKAIATNQPADQRALFLALAQPGETAYVRSGGVPARLPVPSPDSAPAVVLPLAGEAEFVLLVWRGDSVRVCRRWPRSEYDALVARFESTLDGQGHDFAALDTSARDWHNAVRRCEGGDRRAERWHVVAVPGTRQLPWAWIAGADIDDEPAVEIVFRASQADAAPFERPTTATLLDLDMPTVAPLPFAMRERDMLLAAFDRYGLRRRVVNGAGASVDDVLGALREAALLHVVGHANPAAYGQLYQGVWFESGGKPLLLTYPEIAATPSQAQLVVLSACGTTDAAGAAFGAASKLPEAFIASGAKHVVAASNALSDAAATLWTRAFYESLWKNGDVAYAARAARAALRATPHFRHPKFWAGIDAYAGESDIR